MLYAILCYQAEGAVCAMSKDADAALMADLAVTKSTLSKRVKFGTTARLMPTTAATTVRHGRAPMVIDGPFAETKEQLLGFYVLECESLQHAIEAAQGLAGPRDAAGLSGSLEIRPISYIEPGNGA
jgi:hypothetical protein